MLQHFANLNTLHRANNHIKNLIELLCKSRSNIKWLKNSLMFTILDKYQAMAEFPTGATKVLKATTIQTLVTRGKARLRRSYRLENMYIVGNLATDQRIYPTNNLIQRVIFNQQFDLLQFQISFLCLILLLQFVKGQI